MSHRDAAGIIRTLQLASHPEGGWYREIFAAPGHAAEVAAAPEALRAQLRALL